MPRFVKLTEIFSYNWKKCIPDEKTKHWLSQPLRDHSVAFPWERAGWRQGSPVFLSLGTIDILDQTVSCGGCPVTAERQQHQGPTCSMPAALSVWQPEDFPDIANRLLEGRNIKNNW